MPLYTSALTTSEFGTVDLLIQAANLIIPIASLGIVSSVIRWALDKDNNKADVFSTGLYIILIGSAFFAAVSPFVYLFNHQFYIFLIAIYIFTALLKNLFSQFVRSLEMTKLYSIDGVISTITTLTFTVIFLLPMKLGINGYLLAIIISDLLSAIILAICAKLWKYVKPISFKSDICRKMLKYALPMIPTTLFWWITNVSDRMLVYFMAGSDQNGLYAISYKIPTIMVLVSNIFMDAWQISSTTISEKERPNFYAKVFDKYQALIFIVSGFIILCSKTFMKILVDSSFFEAWRFIPVLTLGMVFSCFVVFFGSIYMVKKNSTSNMLTTLIGAIINIAFNVVMIPKYGVMGSAFATFVSYFIVFIIRVFDTKKHMKFKWNKLLLIFNTILLSAICYIVTFEISNWVSYGLIICGLILIPNTICLVQNIPFVKKR